jgi:hypothetical protein
MQQAERRILFLGRHLAALDHLAERLIQTRRILSVEPGVALTATVGMPACAQTCATPSPIAPQPMTPTFLISIVCSL